MLASLLMIGTLAHQTRGQEVVEEKENFPAEQIEFFETKIRPLLVEKCYHCHSTDAPELRGELYADSRLGLITGGDSGAAISPGQPDDSLLIDSINYRSMEMPPNGKLDPEQIAALTHWVEIGAPWPRVTSAPGAQSTSEKTDWTSFDWDRRKLAIELPGKSRDSGPPHLQRSGRHLTHSRSSGCFRFISGGGLPSRRSNLGR